MKYFLILFAALSIAAGKHHVDKHEKHHKGHSFKTKDYKKKHFKGLVKTKESKSFLKATMKTSFLHMDAVVPGKADISKLVSPPEDQGQCGSCWDFSLTKALRSAYMTAGVDPGQLEFNFLLNNCGKGPSQGGCNGGDFNAAESFKGGAGPGLNKDNPYTQQDGGSCKNLKVAATATSYTMLGSGNNGPTFKDYAYAVGVLHQALSIDVAAGAGSWESYSSGVYNDCVGTQNDIDHMINGVGYDCESSIDTAGNCVFNPEGAPINGDGYILVMNNWGTSWGTTAASGLGGYMKTKFGCNAVATTALMFTVPVTPIPPVPPVPPVPPTPPTPDDGHWAWYVWLLVGVGITILTILGIGALVK